MSDFHDGAQRPRDTAFPYRIWSSYGFKYQVVDASAIVNRWVNAHRPIDRQFEAHYPAGLDGKGLALRMASNQDDPDKSGLVDIVVHTLDGWVEEEGLPSDELIDEIVEEEKRTENIEVLRHFIAKVKDADSKKAHEPREKDRSDAADVFVWSTKICRRLLLEMAYKQSVKRHPFLCSGSLWSDDELQGVQKYCFGKEVVRKMDVRFGKYGTYSDREHAWGKLLEYLLAFGGIRLRKYNPLVVLGEPTPVVLVQRTYSNRILDEIRSRQREEKKRRNFSTIPPDDPVGSENVDDPQPRSSEILLFYREAFSQIGLLDNWELILKKVKVDAGEEQGIENNQSSKQRQRMRDDLLAAVIAIQMASLGDLESLVDCTRPRSTLKAFSAKALSVLGSAVRRFEEEENWRRLAEVILCDRKFMKKLMSIAGDWHIFADSSGAFSYRAFAQKDILRIGFLHNLKTCLKEFDDLKVITILGSMERLRDQVWKSVANQLLLLAREYEPDQAGDELDGDELKKEMRNNMHRFVGDLSCIQLQSGRRFIDVRLSGGGRRLT